MKYIKLLREIETYKSAMRRATDLSDRLYDKEEVAKSDSAEKLYDHFSDMVNYLSAEYRAEYKFERMALPMNEQRRQLRRTRELAERLYLKYIGGNGR